MKLEEVLDPLIEKNLLEMANLDGQDTGIDNVIIWVGMDPHQHYLRVKVSNAPDKWSNDNFTITIPDLIIIGKRNKQLITTAKLADIKKWIRKNLKTIAEYEQGKIVSTRELLLRLKKLDKYSRNKYTNRGK